MLALRGQLTDQRVTYTEERGDFVSIVRDVPAGVCGQCGERYLSPDTVDVLQELLEHGGMDKVAEILHVPVFDFPEPARTG